MYSKKEGGKVEMLLEAKKQEGTTLEARFGFDELPLTATTSFQLKISQS